MGRFWKGVAIIGTSAYVNAVYAPLIVDNYLQHYIPVARHWDDILGHNGADLPHALTYLALTAGTSMAFLGLWNGVRRML